MSSKKQPAPKRKQSDSSAPEVLQPLSDEEVVPPLAKISNNRGLAMFEASVQEHCPSATHSGSGGNTCSIEGVVLRGGIVKVGSANKWEVTVAVTRVSATGCKDIINTGMDGMAWSLPVKNLEASPEEKAKNIHAKGPAVIDMQDGRANFLGLFRSSFYIEDKKHDSKNQPVPAVEECIPGTKVLITGCCSTYGKSGVDGRLYTNGKKMVPLLSEVGPGEAAQAIINEARSANVQASAAFLWSMAMNGFFGLTYTDACLQQQADACKAKWGQLLSGAAAKCESIALSLGNDDTQTLAVQTLNEHASRIKSMTPEDAASGAPIFLSDLDKECTTPYYAPLVQYNISPCGRNPDFCKSLFDPATRGRVPNSFVEAQVKQVEFKGTLVTVDYRLFMVFEKAAAIAAADDETNPVLHSTNAAASVKYTKRSVGPELVGSLVDTKVETALQQILPYANQAVWACVFPRAAEDNQLSGFFAPTAGIDFIDGIVKVGIQISVKWLDETLLDGTGVYIYEKPDGVAIIEPLATNSAYPTLKTAGYQALSEASFSLKNIKAPEGKVKKYYVIYDGCAANVAGSPAIATSTEAGEAHLADIVASARDDNDPKMFLIENAIVYCVAALAEA